MRAEAKEAPNRIVVEAYDGKADIVLVENIELIDKDGEGSYVFDLYRLTVSDRPGLAESVESNFEAWITSAKEAEAAPKPKSVEERVETVETTTDQVVDILAQSLGVVL